MTRRTHSTRPAKARGFTLVELMVVIVILGGLIAIVGPNVFQALSKSDVQRAETQMSNFGTSLKMYYFNHRKYPSSLDALTEVDPKTGEAYMDEVPDDPWGNAYDLKVLSGNRLKLTSFGKDGQEGTEDDIVWPPTSED